MPGFRDTLESMGRQIQLHAGAGRRSGKGGDDSSTDWLIRKLTAKGAGLPKAEQARLRDAASVTVYQARRELWISLVFEEPIALANALRTRALDSDDYSNRKKITDLRIALAAWVDGFSKAWKKKERRAERMMEKKSKGHPFRSVHACPPIKRQMPLFGPASWPLLSPDNEKAMLRSWPHVDLVADRDGAVLMDVSLHSSSPWVVTARRAMVRAIKGVIEWNGKLVVSTMYSQFFAGDSLSLSTSDLLSVGQEGLARGAMDINPSVARPSTHYVTWIAQRMRRAIEKGTLIHVPSWIRDTNAAIRRGSTAWQKADKARRLAGLAEGKRYAREHGCRDDAHDLLSAKTAAGAVAFREKLKGINPDHVIGPIDPHEAHRAVQMIQDGGLSLEILTDNLALHHDTANAIMLSVDPFYEGAADPLTAALAPLSASTKIKPDTIRKAIAQAPHYVASLDRRGRVNGDDDDDDRPAIVLVAEEHNAEADAESRVAWRQIGEGIEGLRSTGPAGKEQAEVIRRFHGLDGPAESLTAIAGDPLQSTKRKVNRNKAKELRDTGIAWLKSWAAGEKMSGSDARREHQEASIAHHPIEKQPKRRRKMPPRPGQLREDLAASA